MREYIRWSLRARRVAQNEFTLLRIAADFVAFQAGVCAHFHPDFVRKKSIHCRRASGVIRSFCAASETGQHREEHGRRLAKPFSLM